MSKVKYLDTAAIVNVLGGLYQKPELFDDPRYTFGKYDFPEKFHFILYSSMFNLYQLGTRKFSPSSIAQYLDGKGDSFVEFQANKGEEYCVNLGNEQIETFDFSYHRLKKMSLLEAFRSVAHMDLSFIYDPDELVNQSKVKKQLDWLDGHTEQEICDVITNKIEKVRIAASMDVDTFEQAGNGVHDLLDELEQFPDVGRSMYDPTVSYILLGSRFGKFYLRSAATGVGKSRTQMAEACWVACPEIYDLKKQEWRVNTNPESAVYIGTEQELDELQTMALCFISGVNEEHIKRNKYEVGEKERVRKAADILTAAPLHFKTILDFSSEDIENSIKYAVREFNAKYIWFDYIHSSMKILSEVASKAKVKGLREDNVLFMLSVKLKELATKYQIHLTSATQLSNDYHSSSTPDQGLLAGAKAIANKADAGMIMMDLSPEDEERIKVIVEKQGCVMPNVKMSVYKNRGGRWKNIMVWFNADRGTCRFDTLFVTDWSYRLVTIGDKEQIVF